MSARFGPDELIACYRRGVFPMAESREADQLFLVDPDWRGILPLDAFHVPRRLARTVRAETYRATLDHAFDAVMSGCAEPKPGREETWINPAIRALYNELHRRGQAHSVECWDETGALVGGLYGVSVGAAFFGESMFSRARDASKVALVHLVARLKAGGYQLLDAQFWTAHLSQFGLVQVPRGQFRRRLEAALASTGHINALGDALTGDQALQSLAQTS
jgi:leucyl/phenylalanyl-tRNA--protein transferase